MSLPTTTNVHSVTLTDARPPQGEPTMSNRDDPHARVRLTSRWIEVDGRPSIPVSGELHYSRVPRDRWEEELRMLVASGITMVSTYVFWIHHEPVRGRIDFSGDLDLAAFVETADRVGIDLVLRIGPWAHGEARNGGFPDWLLDAAPTNRQDDPVYLALAAEWYSRIAEQVSRFCGWDGRIVGIQIENELYDQPQHLATLKRLAREAGMTAPLWTATAWGGAELPAHDLFPVYSGYADGFWAGQGSTWDDSFRDHFTFTHVWDDPGVGGDQREEGVEIVVRGVDPEFPPATCELGGGMATAYHRRPLARGADIAAVANVKVGNGSLWQGFYMYAGGINPRDRLQESHSTGYPNDLPRFDYDFQAAIGATGQAGAGLALLREHNAFLASFGDRLADMSSSLPDGAPVDVHDLHSLRWAVRSDGTSGFVFINTHQPHEPLHGVDGVQLRISGGGGDIVVPDRPIDIPSGVIARWPLRLDVAGVRIEWATASVIGLVEGERPTLVLRAHEGVDARIRFASASASSGAAAPVPPAAARVSLGVEVDGAPVARDETIPLRAGSVLTVDGALRILVVDGATAERLWFVDGELLQSDVPVWREPGGLVARASAEPRILRWGGSEFVPLAAAGASATGTSAVALERLRDAAPVPARYGEFHGRSSAPTDAQFDAVAAVWRLDVAPHPDARTGDRVELVIAWEGDVAQLRADGVLIGDRFWDGQDWRIDVTRVAPGAELSLHIAPISSQSRVDLDATVAARVAAGGTLCAVLTAERVVSARWEVGR